MARYRPRAAIERAKFWIAVAEADLGKQKPSRLVSDWRKSWRWASVQLAILAPIALEALWSILSSAPPELRAYIRLPLFIALGALAWLARVWNQDKK